MERATPFDRDPILITEHLIDVLDCSIHIVYKALVDPIWQAAGWEQSVNFPNGKWTPKR